MKTRIENATLVLPDSCLQANLEICDEHINYIGPAHQGSRPDHILSAKNKYLLAGFIDVHSNGIAGFDLTNGTFSDASFSDSESDYSRGLEQAAAAYAATGVTRVLLTSLAAPLEKLQHVFNIYGSYRCSGQASFLVKNIFAGLYVEGTFMKEWAFRGAHNSDYFFEPSIALFEKLQSAGQGNIRVVNVVPEWEQAGRILIKHVHDLGLIAAAGHTAADGICYEKAIEQGVTLAVHLFNGPTGSSFKPFARGAALEAILRSKKVMAELIVDGYHVDPAYVLDAIRRKGIDRVMAVTDSMFATGLTDLTDFSILGVSGQVSENRRYLQVKGRPDTLCGSVLTMDQAFANLLTWFTQEREGIWYEKHEPLSFEQALLKATALCSKNPAALLGLNQTGSVEINKQADILIAEIRETDSGCQVEVQNVFVKGKQVC